jgi:predicted PurR-regulated permease PerM
MEIKKQTLYYIIVAAVLILTFIMLRPFILTLILAAIFAYFFMPVYKRLVKAGLSKRLTAALLTLMLVLIFIGFVEYGIRFALTEFGNVSNFINSFNLANHPYLEDIAKVVFSRISSSATNALVALPMFFLSAVIFFVAVYFFLIDHEKINSFLAKILPFDKEEKAEIFNKIKQSIDSFIYVQLLIGILQGIFAAIGLYIFGVPYVIAGAIIVTILSIVPSVGTSLFYVPAGAYLILTHSFWPGVGLLAYGLVIGGVLDNVIRPYVFGKRAEIHLLSTIIGFFAGVVAFGVVGIIIGPILMSVAAALLNRVKITGG